MSLRLRGVGFSVQGLRDWGLQFGAWACGWGGWALGPIGFWVLPCWLRV